MLSRYEETYDGMQEAPDGAWVWYADVQSIINAAIAVVKQKTHNANQETLFLEKELIKAGILNEE